MEEEGRTYQDIVVTELRQRDLGDAVRLWLVIAGTCVSHIPTNYLDTGTRCIPKSLHSLRKRGTHDDNDNLLQGTDTVSKEPTKPQARISERDERKNIQSLNEEK